MCLLWDSKPSEEDIGNDPSWVPGEGKAAAIGSKKEAEASRAVRELGEDLAKLSKWSFDASLT